MKYNTPFILEVVKDQLYLGNLSGALSVEQRDQFSITHIVSVCPDYPSTGSRHLTIAVQDSEHENLLIHLAEACCFIQNALNQGGRILLHCVMGISRSPAVLAAYIMKARNMTASNAIRFIKQRRPQVHPNYGFIKQLDVFEKCGYEPSSSHPQYRSWKRRHVQDVNNYLNHIVDTVAIIPNKLLMTSEFPDDPEQAQFFLQEIRVTHLLSISPAENTFSSTSVLNHHVTVNSQSPGALSLVLPSICDYICDSMKNNGLVLVHCRTESWACTAVCAYMMSRGSSYEQAFCVIQNVLPLFSPTNIFLQNLERFQASPYMARSEQLIVKNTVSSPPSHSNSAVLTSSTNPNEPKHITPINGHGTDSGVYIDSNSLKITSRHSRLLSLSVR